jgi:hypothetical protein
MSGVTEQDSATNQETTMARIRSGMSNDAQDILELMRLAVGGAGTLTQHLLREYAARIIGSGVRSELGGC